MRKMTRKVRSRRDRSATRSIMAAADRAVINTPATTFARVALARSTMAGWVMTGVVMAGRAMTGAAMAGVTVASVAMIGVASFASTAHAQTLQPVPVPPPLAPGGYQPAQSPVPEGVGVADRPRIDYLPVGGRVGAFFLYPQMEVSGGSTDNLRASDAGKLGDGYVNLAGNAQLVSGFSRHSLRLGTWFARPFYLSHGGEDASRYGVSSQIRLDFGRFSELDLDAGAERAIVDRTDYNSPENAASPIRYDKYHGGLGFGHVFNRLKIYASGAIADYRYHDGATDGGAPISQRFRDETVTSGGLDVEYELHPGLGLVIRGSHDRQAYALAADSPLQPGGLDRDSTGWRLESGVHFNLTGQLYGELRAGYMWRSYDDLRLHDTRGFSFNADVSWNVTPLATVRLIAGRQIEEAASTTSAGNDVVSARLGVDYELQRNLIASVSGGYAHYAPLGPDPSSKEWSSRIGAKYLLNRQFSARIELSHAGRTSADVTRSYAINAVVLGLTVSL